MYILIPNRLQMNCGLSFFPYIPLPFGAIPRRTVVVVLVVLSDQTDIGEYTILYLNERFQLLSLS
jgi:hypothetical protein